MIVEVIKEFLNDNKELLFMLKDGLTWCFYCVLIYLPMEKHKK